MKIPVFEHHTQTGETTAEQKHTQTEAVMSNNDNTLPTDVFEKIEDFKNAKAVFFDWRGKYSGLLDKAKNQTALAETAEAEAEQHQEALRNLVRDLVRAESGDKEEINALSAKMETARSLAAEHRTFAADLLSETEKLKPYGLLAAKNYYYARRGALGLYADSQFKAILNSIDEQILKAIKLKSWSYQVIGDKNFEGTATEAAVHDIGVYFKNRLSGSELDKTTDETLAMLAPRADIGPFTPLDFANPFDMAKLQQKLKDQERAA